MAVLTPDQLANLPDPVLRSLAYTGVLKADIPSSVSLTQTGRIKSDPKRNWMTFTAEETYSLDRAGFTWAATVRTMGIPMLRVTDQLQDGQGRMRGRLLGLVTLFNETGPNMDQGSLVRWLNETMWFPWAWATGLITWEPVDAHAAIGTVTAGDTTASGEFRFDQQGRLVDFVADRYRDGDDDGLTRWSTPITEHDDFDGLELPAAGRAVWHLEDGDFTYIELEIEEIGFEG